MASHSNSLITVYYTHKPGGLCRRLYELCDALVAEGRPTIFYSLDPESHLLDARVERRKIPFFLEGRSGLLFWVLFSLWVPLFLLWELRGEKCEAFVFHPFYWLLLVPCRALRRVTSITTFYRSIGSRTYAAQGATLRRVVSAFGERLAARFSDRVVFQTEAMRTAVLGDKLSSRGHVYLLPNSTPSHTPNYVDSHCSEVPFRCLVVGVFDRAKNIEVVLRSFRYLPSSLYSLAIVGDGPDLPRLRVMAEQYGLSSVQFVGWVKDASSYYSSSDILVHPSLNEGMPNAVLEAFAHNLVVFGSDTPEIRELLGWEGLVFNPSRPDELLRLLRAFADNVKFQSQAKKHCKERAMDFAFDWGKRAAAILLG